MKATTQRLSLIEVLRGSRELELALDAAVELVADVLRERTGSELLLRDLLEEATVALARDSVRRVAGDPSPLENSLAAAAAPTRTRIHASAVEAAEAEARERSLEERIERVELAIENVRRVLRGV